MTKKDQKRTLREVYAAEPAILQYMPWSEMPISFDCRDHLTSVRHGGKSALVLDPIIDGYHLIKVLMDGGSSLNLIYAETLHKMQIDQSRIQPTKTKFKGIIPGIEASPLGRITLGVVFGMPDNYRLEPLSIEVVPFKSG